MKSIKIFIISLIIFGAMFVPYTMVSAGAHEPAVTADAQEDSVYDKNQEATVSSENQEVTVDIEVQADSDNTLDQMTSDNAENKATSDSVENEETSVSVENQETSIDVEAQADSLNTGNQPATVNAKTQTVSLNTGVYTTTKGVMNYALFTPNTITPSMPLIVFLHGQSARGDDISDAIDHGFPKFLVDGNLGDVPAYVLVPQLPASASQWKSYDAQVMELITFICNTYSIDKTKISLTGQSLGGKGCWSFAINHSDAFCCIAPVSGVLSANDTELQKLSTIPIRAFIGDKDNDDLYANKNISNLNRLKEINPNFTLTIVEDADHSHVAYKVYTANKKDFLMADGSVRKLPEIVNWLLSNSGNEFNYKKEAAIPKVKSIRITARPSNKVYAGQTVILTAIVKPQNAIQTVKWSSSNKKYATVNNMGVVTTKKAGAGKKVTITAKATDKSGKKAKIKIKILKKKKTKKKSKKKKSGKASKKSKAKSKKKAKKKKSGKASKKSKAKSKKKAKKKKAAKTSKKSKAKSKKKAKKKKAAKTSKKSKAKSKKKAKKKKAAKTSKKSKAKSKKKAKKKKAKKKKSGKASK